MTADEAFVAVTEAEQLLRERRVIALACAGHLLDVVDLGRPTAQACARLRQALTAERDARAAVDAAIDVVDRITRLPLARS